MSDPSLSFDELMARVRDGDADAMVQLVQQYEPEVRIVARARLGAALRPHLDSIDLVQSVHRTILVGLRDEKFDISSPEKLLGLAMTIVRRKAARQWRHIQRQQRLDANGDGAVERLLQSLCEQSPDPLTSVTVKDSLEHVLREMNETERELIRLRLSGYTTAEAARKLGRNPDVVRASLSRLRRRLWQLGVAADVI